MKPWKTRFLIAVAGLALAGAAQAQTAAFTPPVLTAFGDEPNGNDGEFFTLNAPITVTGLGYVLPSDPIGSDVGLFDVTTNTLLASSVLTSASTANGQFLYNSIAPITLASPDEYAVVGFYTPGNGSVGYTADSGVGAAPAINFIGYAYDNNGGLDIPTNSYAPPIFGPNFTYAAVPEPSSWALGLIAVGFFGLVGLRRIRA